MLMVVEWCSSRSSSAAAKMVRRRCAVEHAQELGSSERHACRLVYQPRGTQRYQPTQRNDEDALTRAIIALPSSMEQTGARTLYIEPGSPWENGYCESFNSKLRDEFLNGEIFYSLKEVQVLAERWPVPGQRGGHGCGVRLHGRPAHPHQEQAAAAAAD